MSYSRKIIGKNTNLRKRTRKGGKRPIVMKSDITTTLIPTNTNINMRDLIRVLTNNLNKNYEKFQIIGGFVYPTDVKDLNNLKVENVLKRLLNIINNYNKRKNNIYAISELVFKDDNYTKNVETENLIQELNKHNIHNDSFKDDLGFLSSKLNLKYDFKCDEYTSELSLYDNFKIVNLHFESYGPNANGKAITIEEFILNNLLEIDVENVKILCGDTNITISKSNRHSNNEINDIDDKVNLMTLTRKIANGFREVLEKDVVVIMSNIKVKKVRSGFILRNQQLEKSVPTNIDSAECDGTVIVIVNDIIKKNEFIRSYEDNNQYRYFFTNDKANNFNKISIEHVEALKF